MRKLTHSQLKTLQTCLRKYHLRYNLQIERDVSAMPLRFGSAVHQGIEAWCSGAQEGDAIERATAELRASGEDVAAETAEALLSGYFWRYREDLTEVIEVEHEFDLPLVNPETSASSRTFRLAGKWDALCKFEGRAVLRETKTTGENIAEDSAYWQRLRFDPQITLYILAAREAGFDVTDTLYDVIRKPSIAPKQIPELDEEGHKIVLDETGERVFNKNGAPRQSSGQGLTLVTRTETAKEFGDRLLADIGERPEFYYARRVVPRLQADLEEFRLELWQAARLLADCRNNGRWFRNVGRFTCDWCEYRDLCLSGESVDPENPPPGFRRRENKNPELGGRENGQAD